MRIFICFGGPAGHVALHRKCMIAVVKSDKAIDTAAARLAAIFENYFARLPPGDRVTRVRAFDRVIARIGSRAKS